MNDCLATDVMSSFGAGSYCCDGMRKFSIACSRRACYQDHHCSTIGSSSGASRPDRTDDAAGSDGHTDESPHRHGDHLLHTTDVTNGKNRPLCWHVLPRSNSGRRQKAPRGAHTSPYLSS